MKSPYRSVIEKIAALHDLDPLLVEAVVLQESSGRADAFRFEPGFWERYLKKHPRWKDWEPRRAASSYGLMQIMAPVAFEHGFSQEPEALFGIATNIEIGCRVLARLLERFSGDVEKALAAYNGGIGGVGREQPQRYAREVQAKWAALRTAPTGSSSHRAD